MTCMHDIYLAKNRYVEKMYEAKHIYYVYVDRYVSEYNKCVMSMIYIM